MWACTQGAAGGRRNGAPHEHFGLQKREIQGTLRLPVKDPYSGSSPVNPRDPLYFPLLFSRFSPTLGGGRPGHGWALLLVLSNLSQKDVDLSTFRYSLMCSNRLSEKDWIAQGAKSGNPCRIPLPKVNPWYLGLLGPATSVPLLPECPVLSPFRSENGPKRTKTRPSGSRGTPVAGTPRRLWSL